MLCILSRHYPFFNASDDLSALAEIIRIHGFEKVASAARKQGRTLEIKNIEAQDQRPYLTDLGAKLKGWQRKAFKFMMKCLALSPKSRIRADQALKNSFLARKIPRD